MQTKNPALGLSGVTLVMAVSGCGAVNDEPVAGRSDAVFDPVLARITADDPSFVIRDDTLSPGSSTETGLISESGRNYAVVQNGRHWTNPIRHEFVSRNEHCLGGHGLCLLFNAKAVYPNQFDESTWSNDRLEVILDNGFNFDYMRILRFYIQLDPDFRLATEPSLQADPAFKAQYDSYYGQFDEYDYIISQIWQYGSGRNSKRTNDMGPVAAIYLETDPTDYHAMYLSFRYRNDQTAACPETNKRLCQTAKYATEFYRTKIAKGQWYNFYVYLHPTYPAQHVGKGGILVWQDRYLGTKLNYWEADNYRNSSFYWGFTPEAVITGEETLMDRFAIRVGVYRAIPSTYAPFRLDSIKLTGNWVSMESGL
jgi:hypothetical protein